MRSKSQQLKSKQIVSSRQKFAEKIDAKIKSVNIFNILRKFEELNECKQRHMFTETFDWTKVSKIQEENNVDPERTRTKPKCGEFFNLLIRLVETKIDNYLT